MAEGVARYLEQKIIQNELKPETRLIERNLAESLGVSRISIREAFRILALSGLVKIIPRKGAQVTAITKQEVEEIYTLRVYLVGLAAKLAARNIGPEDMQELKKIGRQMAGKNRKNDLKSYFDLHLKFHRILSQAGGNQRLHQILANFEKQTHRFRFASMGIPGRMKRSYYYHKRLLESIQDGNEKMAEKIARTSIEEAGRALLGHPFENSSDFRGLFKTPDSSAE